MTRTFRNTFYTPIVLTILALLVFPFAAFAAELGSEAVLSSNLLSPTEVSTGGNSFEIKVWAAGRLQDHHDNVAYVVKKYTMGTNGTISPSTNVSDREAVTFTKPFHYTDDCPANPIKGCQSNPFIVQATLTVASGTPANTSGTLTVDLIPSASGLEVKSGSEDTGYVKVAGKQNQTISFTSTAPSNAVYGDTYNVSATATSGLSVSFGASGACSISGSTVSMTGVGTCTVTADQGGDASWNAAPQVSQVFSVGKRAITVTADAQSKEYGNADPQLTYKVTSGSLHQGDSFSGSLSRDAGEAVGQYDIKQGTLSAGDNYNLTFVSAKLTITERAITVTADAKSKQYGDDDPALTYKITNGLLLSGDSLSGALSRAAGENVGTYAIQQGTLSASSNYKMTFVGANFSITARPITVAADAKSKIFGEADPALTYQVTSGSLLQGDSFSGALARAAGEAVGTYAIQQGTLTAGSNYNLTYVGANLTIGAWTPLGFHSPIGISNSFYQAPGGAVPGATSSTVWQTAKGGSVIPLKFNVFAGDAEKTNTTDVKGFGAVKLSTCSGSTLDPVEELATSGSTSLRYDTAERQFIQNWKTGSVSGDTCYRVTVTFQDNTAIHTFVRLRK